LQSTIEWNGNSCRETNVGVVRNLLTSSYRFFPDHVPRIIGHSIPLNLINNDWNVSTIFIGANFIAFRVGIRSIVIPWFPREVLFDLGDLNCSTYKVPHIILRFKVSLLKRILITNRVSDVRSEVHCGTLTLDPVSIRVGNVRTL